MKYLQQLLLVVLTAMTLSACGPVYDTTYSYINPKSGKGKSCIRQCLVHRSQCRQSCQQQYNSCQGQAQAMSELDYRLDQIMNKDKKNRSSYRPSYNSHCTKNCGCTETYNTCFSSCGGTIVPHTKCVAFCDKK